ncbi:MAG: helix-turn-helix transcriptional regulator, partial [Clostridia bacterium]|nr:helix-turn-helix transcriptional regulator [Clostridia bacterium]
LLELLSQSKENSRSDLCELVLASVRKNFADPSLTNESIAKAMNYHPYHINRVVKKDTGYALRTYIIEYRLSVAKNLLLTTKNTISQVAEACGFASTSYFTKLFKEKNGIPPKEYRKSRIHSEI